MTLEEFRRLADVWGGDIERWPAQRRAAARERAATEEGASVLLQARRLDAVLEAAPVLTADRASRAAFAVVQRIAAEASDAGRAATWRQPTWLIPVAGLTCSALIGVSLAILAPYGGSNGSAVVLSAILDTGSMPATWVIQ